MALSGSDSSWGGRAHAKSAMTPRDLGSAKGADHGEGRVRASDSRE